MSGRPGLRRPVYSGDDTSADQAFRSIADILRFLQKLPFSDGVFLQGVDFSKFASAEIRTYPLKHTLRRLARGILAVGCHPLGNDLIVPGGLPSHVKSNDTNQIANVCMTADMANKFTWDFWIW